MAWYLNLPWILAQAAPAQAATEAAGEGGMSVALRLIAAAAVIVGSFVAGVLIARALRMSDYGFKIGLVLFTIVASAVITWAGWPPKRGIDLSGGVVLVYEVDRGSTNSESMRAAIARVSEVLNEAGGERIEVKPAGPDKIEVVAPGEASVSQIEGKVAELRNSDNITLLNEGRRTANDQTIWTYRLEQRADRALDMQKLIDAVNRRINPSGVKELTIRQYGAEQLEVIIPEVDEGEIDQIKRRISTSGLLEFRIVANQSDDGQLIKTALRTPGRDVYIGGNLAGRWVKAGPELRVSPADATFRETPAGDREILVRIDPFNVDGRYLARASQGFDKGRLAVDFAFDSEGAEKFGQLTSRNLPDPPLYRQLGIILDNVMLSAPQINSAIYGSGQITGNFNQEEIDFLVGVLNAGSLPATLRPQPISQQRISSQLGDDTVRAGALAMGISTVAILIFMVLYYRFAGLVADIAVSLNVLMVLALMILIKAAFTLPGLAGLVLTVGMAVDANVLIYERMREETERGASLRMAIRNGFSRAMSTIIDSNLTTLITAVVLYVIGTDQIKGFAVTLILGLLVSMFTAIYVSRIIFDVAERKGWLRKLNMMKFVGVTHFDFVRWRNPAMVASAIFIAIGLVAAASRGKELLDIDFTGGTSIQVLFKADQPQDITDVREAVSELPDVAVSSVGEGNRQFKIDTSNKDLNEVKAELQKAFGASLESYSMKFGPLTKIEAEPTATEGAQAAPSQTPVLSAPSSEQAPAATQPAAETPAAQPAVEAPAEQPAAETQPEPAAPAPETEAPAANPPAETPAAPENSATENEPAVNEPAAPDSASRGPAAELQLAAANNQVAIAQLLLAQEQPAAEQAPAAEQTPAAETPAAQAPPAEAAQAADTATAPATESTDQSAAPTSLVGGTRATMTFPQEISYEPLREMVEQALKDLKIEGAIFELKNPNYQAGSEARYSEWTLETSLQAEQTQAVLERIQSGLASTPVFPSSSEIGGKVAGDTQLAALYAILGSMVMIVLYVWIRFQNLVFGLAAVLALVHDVLVTIGFLALSAYLSPYMGALLVDPFKISLAVVAALLTIVGFSINDTIVIFDRMREIRGKSTFLTPQIVNDSINQTLSRTILTSGTVFIATLILYFVGGPGIHPFAFAMLIGVIAGTYSTIYIAAPLVLWMRASESNGNRSNGPTSKVTTSAGSR